MALDAMKALRLTRAGRLNDAVRLIQEGLAGTRGSPVAAPSSVIDLTPLARVMPLPGAAAPVSAPVATTPGPMVECRHRGSAGTLDYLLYLPADARPGLPLVIMLHGCTQSPEDFARGTGMNPLADKAGVIVAYPRQTSAANPQKCWNWFRAADLQRDRGEPALIAGIVHDILRDHAADPTRVYVAGLSAGGAAAATMAALYPDLFAAVAIHSGLAHGAARNLTNALAAMRNGSQTPPPVAGTFVPTITFHGDRDTTVSPVNSDQVVAAAAAAYGASLTTTVEDGTKAGGHRYRRAISRDAAGKVTIEQWTIAGAGHAWSGGDRAGSYTDPAGPAASEEMLRFFLQHRRP